MTLKEFKYKIAEYLYYRSSSILNQREEKKKQLIIDQWEDKFTNSNKFIHTLDGDTQIVLYNDSRLSKLIYDGFEQDEMNFLKRLLKPDDIFIDIGANIGMFSLLAASLVGENGKVICYEPSIKTYDRLIENIQLNKFKNVIAVNKGLSNSVGELELNISENGYDAWNTFASDETDTEKFSKKNTVTVSTLDEELRSVDKNKIKLIKIDVEGWEKFVLNGATDLLTNFSPNVMMEFTETNTFAAGYFVQELYDMLIEYGYKWYRYVNNELMPEKKKLHYPYDNLIAIKNRRIVEDIIK